MTSFREVAEAEATGVVALVYEEVRRTYAVPYVSSLFRHLAVYPGLLPWAWRVLRPALVSGAAQRLAWPRVDVAELPPLPPLTREALAGLGVDTVSLPVIRTVCESFTRVSPINLVVAACLARLLGEGQSGAEPVAVTLEPADLPAPLPAMPGMAQVAEMTPETRAVLTTFETELAGEVFVPGLWRILAHCPGFLAHLSAALGPLLRDPAVLDACERIAAAPTQPELQRLLHAIATRTARALERQGLLTRDDDSPALDIEPADDFEQLLGAAVHYRIATGPHAGRKALTLRTVGSNPPPDHPCIARLSGFSLHAGTVCEAHDRDSLERLCRYIARPALSNERLSVNDRGQVVYRLKHAFRDGTTHVVLDPVEFMRHIRVPHPFGAASGCANRQSCRFGIARLAAPEVPLAARARSVPRPRAHLTRYHGVFAPNCKHRHRIIPNPAHQSAREPQASRPAPMRWMQRLGRVFHVDIEHCGVCGGTLRVIACIETP